MDDIWVLKYIWTLDHYYDVQQRGTCKPTVDMMSFRSTSVQWSAPTDWVQDYIEDEEEQVKERRKVKEAFTIDGGKVGGNNLEPDRTNVGGSLDK